MGFKREDQVEMNWQRMADKQPVCGWIARSTTAPWADGTTGRVKLVELDL